MHWFLDPIQKHYADFNGRATRQQYWMFFVILFGIMVVANIVLPSIVVTIAALAVLVPHVALAVRRVHDAGYSGWLLLIGFIPFLGLLAIIVCLAWPGQKTANKYGASPYSATPEPVPSPAAAAPVVASDTAPMAAGTKDESPADGGGADGSN